MAHPHHDRINERTTTTHTHTSSGPGTGIIVGALVVIVALLAYFMFAGGDIDGRDGVSVTIEESAEGATGGTATGGAEVGTGTETAPEAGAGAGAATDSGTEEQAPAATE